MELWSDGGQDFPPTSLHPTLGRAGQGGTGQGGRVTAEAVGRPFAHVTGDDRGQMGWDGTREATTGRPVKSPALPTQVRILSLPQYR
jgi:hypothetical protein